jgi:sensor histidine kinase YesM
LLFAFIYSGLDYLFKYHYSFYGDVPFYDFGVHLLFVTQWIITPLAIYPFVKYFSPKKRSSYLLTGAGGIVLSFFVAILMFIAVRFIYTGQIGLPFRLVLFNGLDRMVSIGMPATFVFLGYFYMRESAQQKKRVDDMEKVLIQSQIQQLNAGFEPHFLFNNLNILSGLIEENTEKSQQFIQELSSLYRYIVASKKKGIVSINDELKHAQNYLNIINIKFNNAFSLHVKNKCEKEVFVLPNTMQVLIENVIKHNSAKTINPLPVFVSINSSGVKVSNEKRLKTTAEQSTKTGLDSLNERYMLTFGKSIAIWEDENSFSVIVPIVKE